jgi:xanthine dehydrogenase molybdopterin-binding subunit B
MAGEDLDRFVGRSMRRREDHRLLTGRGQFVADLVLPGMLHAVFVRSQLAHGRIRSIDVAKAAAMPGVVRVLTGEKLQRLSPPIAGGQLSLPAKWRPHVQHAIHNPQQPMLAVGKVRHVGEAVAVVVARRVAQDALRGTVSALPCRLNKMTTLNPAASLVGARMVNRQAASLDLGDHSTRNGLICSRTPPPADHNSDERFRQRHKPCVTNGCRRPFFFSAGRRLLR